MGRSPVRWGALALLGMLPSALLGACGEAVEPGPSGGGSSLGASAPALPALGAGRQQLAGHLGSHMVRAPFIRRVDPATRITLTFGLRVRDADKLARAVDEVSDPDSPSFRQYLTPEQFADQYGAPAADYQKLIDWARARNLAIEPHANRLTAIVTGSTADIEQALHVRLNHHLRPDSTQFYAPDREPSLDLDLPIEHIGNLENFEVPRRASSGGSGCVSSGNCGYIFGQNYRTAYAACTSGTGAGQSIGLVSLGAGFLASDISTYRTQGSLPGPAVMVIGPAGSSPDLEDTLDIDMALSMAPGAQIVAFRGSFSQIMANMAQHPEVQQLSSSYFPGNIDQTTRNVVAQLALQGQSYFQATSDAGAFNTNQIGGVNDIRTQPAVTLVGGTDLNMNSPGLSYLSESAWPGSGGGILSNTVNSTGVGTPIPSYQVGLANSANKGSTSFRNVPDVSLVANGIQIVVNGGNVSVGGTSASTPLWAGFMALINQASKTKGLPSVGFANPALYKIGANATAYSQSFRDITVGSNPSVVSPPVSFNAVTGFDLATGLGTPRCGLIGTLSTPLTLADAPSVSARGTGVLEMFARRSDNSIIHRTYNAGFGAWRSMPAITASSAPAAVSWSTTRLDVVTLRSNGQIAHTWSNDSGSTFFAWEDLGCCFDSAPAISSWAANRLDVFARSGGTVRHRAFAGSAGWQPWEDLGGTATSAPAAVSWGTGRIDVFVKGGSNEISHTWFNSSSGWAGAWENLGCCFDVGPGVSSWGVNRLDVFTGSAGQIFHRAFANGWAAWDTAGTTGVITSAPSATSWGTGRIDIMAKGSSNQLVHEWFNSSTGFQGPETLGTLLWQAP